MVLEKDKVWEQICHCMKLPEMDADALTKMIAAIDVSAENYEEVMRYCMDKTVGATDDYRMEVLLKLFVQHGGRKVLARDTVFLQNLMKKAQTHENQFVVIYEDWQKAEAYLNVYNLLQEILLTGGIEK